MIYIKKSQPAPKCLEKEKVKKNGDYKCGDVVARLDTDFYGKCYLCEMKSSSCNVEHFIPHQGNKDLMFDWNNLFLSCSHCNNIKSTREDLLNCTVIEDDVERVMEYNFNPFPKEKVLIKPLDKSEKTNNSAKLLNDIYNGTTELKRLDSDNIRNKLLAEIKDFQELLLEYYDERSDLESKQACLKEIKKALHPASEFVAFKRWIIWSNDERNEDFGEFLSR